MTLRELLSVINIREEIRIRIIQYYMYFDAHYVFKDDIQSKELLNKKVKEVQSCEGGIIIEIEDDQQ